ncbi:MAG: DinB family protein [Bacteroidota bacterium]|nr:DinB family protein [Bacteroidota bacterium]
MKDGIFIAEMLRKGNEAREKVKAQFSHLTLTQLNWKPGEESWSIGQCLDHLIVSDCLYFPAFKKVAEGKHEMSFWENWSPLSGLFGTMLVSQIQEQPRKKLNTPKIFTPGGSTIDPGILERFHKHLDSLLDYIATFIRTDIDKTHITSPVSKVVTYSLRKAILILIQHEHRHINQALQVKTANDFSA